MCSRKFAVSTGAIWMQCCSVEQRYTESERSIFLLLRNTCHCSCDYSYPLIYTIIDIILCIMFMPCLNIFLPAHVSMDRLRRKVMDTCQCVGGCIAPVPFRISPRSFRSDRRNTHTQRERERERERYRFTPCTRSHL